MMVTGLACSDNGSQRLVEEKPFGGITSAREMPQLALQRGALPTAPIG